jgi:hypothetical protein
MPLFADLIKRLLPSLSAELVRPLLNELKEFARSQVVGALLKQVARVLTKGIDGLVKAFVTHLEPPDANRLKNGVLDEFQRQIVQLAESLRVYADAAYQVVVALKRHDGEDDVNSLRNVRERLRQDVEREIGDVFAVLTGGTPED